MEKVTGIGGFFFRSKDTKALATWYEKHLGINPCPESYDQESWRQTAGDTVFAPFPLDTDYFGDPSKMWMINFRVRSLEAMAAQLRAAGITVEPDPQNPYPNGSFARLTDPEGNRIELWEPAGRDVEP
jgi:predicted enzyme related to lactoylglutathione lyase